LGYYAASSGCPETSVRNYHYLLHTNQEERSSYKTDIQHSLT